MRDGIKYAFAEINEFGIWLDIGTIKIPHDYFSNAHARYSL